MATTARSIFFRDERPRGTDASLASAAPTIAIRPPSTPPVATTDGTLIAILDAPLAIGETALIGYARKERELIAVLTTLSVLESRALHLRLSTPRHADELANKFARLTIERRTRVLHFLADARRREALAQGAAR